MNDREPEIEGTGSPDPLLPERPLLDRGLIGAAATKISSRLAVSLGEALRLIERHPSPEEN